MMKLEVVDYDTALQLARSPIIPGLYPNVKAAILKIRKHYSVLSNMASYYRLLSTSSYASLLVP